MYATYCMPSIEFTDCFGQMLRCSRVRNYSPHGSTLLLGPTIILLSAHTHYNNPLIFVTLYGETPWTIIRFLAILIYM